MKRHFKQLLPTVAYSKKKSVLLLILGYFLLVIGLIKTTQLDGFGIGLTYFLGVFSLAIILLAVLSPYLSKHINKDKPLTRLK